MDLFGKSKQFQSDSSPVSSVWLSIILLFAYDLTISYSVLHFELVRNSYELPSSQDHQQCYPLHYSIYSNSLNDSGSVLQINVAHAILVEK